MKKLKVLKSVLKQTNAGSILLSFLIFVFIAAFIILLAEPDITRYQDALWYCYVNLFTIGFGDIVPMTIVGRIVSVLLTVYATVVIAVVTGVVVAFYNESITRNFKESKSMVMDQLEHLPDLSKEELRDLSQRIKKAIE